MNKQFKVYLLTVLAGAGTVHAWQETRTPLSLFEGYMHYPLDRDRELNDFNLDTHFWTGIYFRTAPNAYNNKCGDTTVPGNCCPGRKESLAALYFGQTTFTFEEAFANSFITPGTPINPLVILEPVTINVDYREQGVWFGTTISTRFGCDSQWNTGLRVRIPFRDIKVEPLCGNPITNADASNPVAGLYQQRVESIKVDSAAAQTNNVFAARLDALSVLNRVGFNVVGQQVPLVTYPVTDILIAQQNASGGVPAIGAVTNVSPFLAVIESTNGSVPTSVRWADVPANGTPVLAGDGSGLGNLQRGRVAEDVSYAALSANQVNQSHLWVVPNVQDVGSATPGALIGGAQTVYSTLTNAFNSLANSSLTDFTTQVGLNPCYGNTRGMGDLNMELYLARDWAGCGYFEGRLWATAPTGIKVSDPLQILKFPTGNNGHAEVGLGAAGGIETLRFLAFNFDAYYIWVLKARNNIAAPFVGASVKNIGPCVAAETAWQYAIVDLNMNILNPYCECMGVMFGYQGYVKSHDKLYLCKNSAIDFAGLNQPLDPCVYTKDTHRIAHKIRTETFFNGECMNTFLGFTATVAGKNIPAEVDFHIGLDVYF
jgi:hypothetical protein